MYPGAFILVSFPYSILPPYEIIAYPHPQIGCGRYPAVMYRSAYPGLYAQSPPFSWLYGNGLRGDVLRLGEHVYGVQRRTVAAHPCLVIATPVVFLLSADNDIGSVTDCHGVPNGYEHRVHPVNRDEDWLSFNDCVPDGQCIGMCDHHRLCLMSVIASTEYIAEDEERNQRGSAPKIFQFYIHSQKK